MTAKRKPRKADNARHTEKPRVLNPPIRADRHAKVLIKSAAKGKPE